MATVMVMVMVMERLIRRMIDPGCPSVNDKQAKISNINMHRVREFCD